VTGVESVRERARVVLFGGYDRGVKTTLDLNTIHYKEIELVGSYWVGVPPYQNTELYALALRLIQEKKVHVADLITHRATLDEIHDVFDAIRTRAGLKAMIYIGAKPEQQAETAADD
jgi:threonine dehydrogenase-like Zn-dependent dehydrogenase